MKTIKAILNDTGSFTEVKGEVSDPDRADRQFVETKTFTKTDNETQDQDAESESSSLRWIPGEIEPLLFQRRIPALKEGQQLIYDRDLSMCVTNSGQPLIDSRNLLTETATETATASETTDDDRHG